MTEGFDQAKFDSTLNEYMRWTSKSWWEAVNSHAYYIARKALWFTKKASAADIRSSLRRLGLSSSRTTASGRVVEGSEAPRGQLIINAARRKLGLPSIYGREMAEAIDKLEASRLRSIAFVKSGWLPAIRILEAFGVNKSKAAPMDRAARVRGQEKGSAYPAVEGATMICRIINSVGASGPDRGNVLDRIAGPALDLAFFDETNSMREYIERKMAEDAAKANETL